MILKYMLKELSIDNGGHSFKFDRRYVIKNDNHHSGNIISSCDRDYICKTCRYKIGISYEIINNSNVILEKSLYIFVSDSFGWQRYKSVNFDSCNLVIMKKACE